jgi:uncharacterized membrane protein
MSKARLEAFTDAVIAVILTITVLEIKVPLGGGLDALGPELSELSSDVLGFVFVGIYWNNLPERRLEKIAGPLRGA